MQGRVNKQGIGGELAWNHLARFAMRQLEMHTSACSRYLEESAVDDLIHHISERLKSIMAPTFEVLRCGTLVQKESRRATTRTPKATGVDTETAARLIMAIPAVMETVTFVLWDWIGANRELLNRLDRDKQLLRHLRRNGRGSFRVKQVRPDLSDYHDAGRSVVLLRFVNDDCIIYKPRRGDGELLWFGILRCLNRAQFEHRFFVPEIITRKRYHWMTFIRPRGCRDAEELKHFYRRWGAQAAIATVFRFADLHHENWIAAGAQPILVDAESFGETGAWVKKTQFDSSTASLFKTGLLPFSTRIGLSYRGIAPFDSPQSFKRPPACWPRYRGKVRPPLPRAGEIVRGFKSLLRFIGPLGEAKSRILFPLVSQQTLESRAIHRSTSEYAQLLRHSLQPREMLLAESRFARLYAQCLRGRVPGKVATAEAIALTRCCIPRFTRCLTKRERRLLRRRDDDHFDRFEEVLARFLRLPLGLSPTQRL